MVGGKGKLQVEDIQYLLGDSQLKVIKLEEKQNPVISLLFREENEIGTEVINNV